MYYYIMNDATQKLVHIIYAAKPENLVISDGHTAKEVAGNLGDTWDGSVWVSDPAEALAAERAAITAERDRRLAADFEFQGKMYQRDAVSLSRITGAATLAGFAVAGGAQVNDLRWANPERDFGWIASDNTVTPMDAQTAFAFGQAAAAVETTIVFAAKALREMDPIPANYTEDSWWA